MENRERKTEHQELWDDIKQYNICVIWIFKKKKKTERERKGEREREREIGG